MGDASWTAMSMRLIPFLQRRTTVEARTYAQQTSAVIGRGHPSKAESLLLIAAGAFLGGSTVALWPLLERHVRPEGATSASGEHQPFARTLYLMRGPPGSGKSSVARNLLQQHLERHDIS